jgi:hypothetical protein
MANMSRRLSAYEQETIINFNKAEDIASIFTYEKTWQKHLEGKLGLKPIMDNGFGGKEYELPKSRKNHPRHLDDYRALLRKNWSRGCTETMLICPKT